VPQPVKDWCDVGNLEFEKNPAKLRRAMGFVVDALRL
jgi:hypothetical protein